MPSSGGGIRTPRRPRRGARQKFWASAGEAGRGRSVRPAVRGGRFRRGCRGARRWGIAGRVVDPVVVLGLEPVGVGLAASSVQATVLPATSGRNPWPARATRPSGDVL